MANDLTQYASLLGEIKTRIGQSQTRAAFAANREMLALYWDIGRLITQRQTKEGWGASVVPRLSRDLRNELPVLKGFSEINLNRMLRFYNEYPCLFARRSPQSLSREVSGVKQILSQPVTKLQHIDNKALTSNDAISSPLVTKLNQDLTAEEIDKINPIVQSLIAQLPWTHNTVLIQSVKDIGTRLWYMQQTLEQGWRSRSASRSTSSPGPCPTT
jgi:predicted nuclease of restriction endonuclease-like (RecB) superfamily